MKFPSLRGLMGTENSFWLLLCLGIKQRETGHSYSMKVDNPTIKYVANNMVFIVREGSYRQKVVTGINSISTNLWILIQTRFCQTLNKGQMVNISAFKPYSFSCHYSTLQLQSKTACNQTCGCIPVELYFQRQRVVILSYIYFWFGSWFLAHKSLSEAGYKKSKFLFPMVGHRNSNLPWPLCLRAGHKEIL